METRYIPDSKRSVMWESPVLLPRPRVGTASATAASAGHRTGRSQEPASLVTPSGARRGAGAIIPKAVALRLVAVLSMNSS